MISDFAPTIYPSSAPQTTAALSGSVNSLGKFIMTGSIPCKSSTKRIFRADSVY